MNQIRRRILESAGVLLATAALPALSAELLPTPAQMRGPFYPSRIPLDKDNDLVRVRGRPGVAFGHIVDISGRIVDARGRPQAGVNVEIWQVNGYGRYHHEHDDQNLPLDPNFQGYGLAITDAEGAYRFRTVKPVAYPGRAPHIHFALTRQDVGTFSTQMYLAGAPENNHDFLLSRIANRKARESLIVPLTPSTANTGESSTTFDIVLAQDAGLGRSPVPPAYRLARIGL
ncbi:MAG: intradiol ring-cleavage dioxygenase [Burkholderiales bacterium]